MQFIKTFFPLAALLVTALYAFILAVDPYEKYGYNLFGLENKAVASGRENKFRHVDSPLNKHEAFIVGSSTAHRFYTKVFKELTGLDTYSYAVQHTTPEDNLAVIRHILDKQQPKMIFLQVNFYALNKNFEADNRLYNSPLHKYLKADTLEEKKSFSVFNQTYFTLEALIDSFRTLFANWLGMTKETYDANGDHVYEKPVEGPIKLTQFRYYDYTFDPVRIGYYREIKRLCDEKGVKLVVTMSPLAPIHIQKIFDDPKLKEDFFRFKETIVNIFGTVYDFANFKVVDYDSYRYFHNSTHPTRKLSTLMLQRIFGKWDGPEEFGARLTPENLPAYLKNLRKGAQ